MSIERITKFWLCRKKIFSSCSPYIRKASSKFVKNEVKQVW